MHHSAKTHTPDNAPRASTQGENGREPRDKKKKKERNEMKETSIYSFLIFPPPRPHAFNQ